MNDRKLAAHRGGMARNFMHLGLGQVGTTVLTIVQNAALARLLSPADFGLMYLITSIATFTYVVVDWGYGPYIIREAARFPDRAGELLGSALALRTVFAVAGCGAAVATTWLLGYDLRTRVLTGLLILGSLPQYLGLSFGWVFRSRERMDRDAQLNVIYKLGALLFTVACLVFKIHLLGVIVAWSLAGVITLALAIAMYRRMDLPRLTASTSMARVLVRDGAAIFAMTLAIAIEPFINANILYKLAPADVVGWFGAAWMVAGTLIAPATIVGAAMYPRLSAVAGDAGAFKRAFDMSFRPLLLLAILGAVGTYAFSWVPIKLIYGLRKFGPAAGTLRAFSPVLLLMYVDIFLSMVVVAAGRAGKLAGAKVAAVIVATVLVYFLVPLCQRSFANGGLGVMYGLVIGESLMFVSAAVLARAAINWRTLSDLGRGLTAGVATLFLLQLLPGLTPILAIPLCILLFCVLSLLIGALKKSDVDAVLSSIRK